MAVSVSYYLSSISIRVYYVIDMKEAEQTYIESIQSIMTVFFPVIPCSYFFEDKTC